MQPTQAQLARSGRLLLLLAAAQTLLTGGGVAAVLLWSQSEATELITARLLSWAAMSSQAWTVAGAPLSGELQAIASPIHRVAATAVALLTITNLMLSVWLFRGYAGRMTRLNANLEDLAEQRGGDLIRARDAVIVGLAKLAEFRDADTGQHLDRIGRYVEILAKGLRSREPQRYGQLTDAWIHNLVVGSALHDIGKVGIPDRVLGKPGALTPEERSLIEDHPIIGGECIQAMEQELGDSSFLTLAREIAYSHHEWWDGTGYPFRLEGPAIPLSARIVALADVYDALTTQRPYKPGLAHERCREVILSGAGTQFDPEMVTEFLAQEDAFQRTASEMQRNDLEAHPACDPALDLMVRELSRT